MNIPFRPRMHRWLLKALALLVVGCGGNAESGAAAVDPGAVAAPAAASAPARRLAATSTLNTWWHDNEELNATTPVQDDKVRRSTVYDVKVAGTGAADTRHDSFVYMSLPRSGAQKQGYSGEDGAEFASRAGLSMSWTSFLYGADTWVEVQIKNGGTIQSADDVIVRPTNLNFEKKLVNETTVAVRVPYAESGYRFSVEFKSEQLTSYNDMSGTSGQLSTRRTGMAREVHTEPRHAMLVFAEPMLKGETARHLVPDASAGSIHYPEPGKVDGLDAVTSDIIYFRPGTYTMPANYHAYLSDKVRWIYLAPGAYVKGSFQFPEGQRQFKVTGFGVLSGEKYVYEADRKNGYRHRSANSTDCHRTCVKMLQFEATAGDQHLDLHGITISEPPYHSFVVYGNEDGFHMTVGHYKQVGSWYWQTDGLELYNDSSLRDTFFHANDDVFKLYHNKLSIANVVVWKNENGPVFQWGWIPRDISDIKVSGIDIIHNRIYWRDVKHNTCILNSARHYANSDSTSTADTGMTVSNLLIENVRSEGKNACAMRLYAMSNWKNIRFRNLWIEAWNGLDASSQASAFQALSDSKGVKVQIGNEVTDGEGLRIENYVVGSERISKDANNWQADRPGRLNFDASRWANWNAF